MQMCKAKNALHIRTASAAAMDIPNKPKQQTGVYTKYLTLPEDRQQRFPFFSKRQSAQVVSVLADTCLLRANDLQLFSDGRPLPLSPTQFSVGALTFVACDVASVKYRQHQRGNRIATISTANVVPFLLSRPS